MKKIRYSLLLLLLIHIIGPNSAGAAAQDAYSGVYTLDEIVVSAPADGVEAVATVREVTAEDIEQKGARSLDEALEMVPGINIRTGGQGVPRIDIRGFRTRHILMLLDGIPINSTYDGMFDPSIIPVENIERIKVTYSNSSVLYGQGGLGGVINIVTKRGTEGLHGTVNHEFGEHLSYNGRYSLSGSHKAFDFFLSGSLYKTDGYELSDDFHATSEENGGLRENTDKTRRNLFAKLGFSPNDRWLFGLTVNYLEGEFGRPPNTINDKSNPFAKTVKYERVDDYDGVSLQLSANYDAPGPWEFRSWLYFNQLDERASRYDDKDYRSIKDTSVKKAYHRSTDTRTTGLNLQARYDLENYGLLSFALGGEKSRWEEEGKIRDRFISIGGVEPGDSGGGGTGGGGGGGGGGGSTKTYYMRSYDKDRDIKIFSAATEYEFYPLPDLNVVLGYSHFWLKKDSGDDEDDWSFLVGLNYDLFDTTQLHGAVSRKVRFPTISQLYDEDKGNPSLETERSYNFELGFKQKLPLRTQLNVSGFVNDVEDYIQKDDYTEVNENRDRYRYRGIEVTLETRPWKTLYLKLGYTYLDTDDMSTDTEYDQIQYNPRDKLTLEARYTFSFGLNVYASMRHINRQYYYSKKSPRQKRKLNEFTLFNFKLTQDVYRDKVHVYVGADNVFDKNYETSFGLPREGRFVYSGVKLKF